MRLIGIRRDRRVWIGVDVDGAVSPIAEVDDFYADVRGSLDRARGITRGEVSPGAIELAPPVPPSARVICVGLNYRAHAAEGKFEVPEHPTIFGRWTASLKPVLMSAGCRSTMWIGVCASSSCSVMV